VSLIVTGLVLASGVVIGRLIAVGLRRRAEDRPKDRKEPDDAPPPPPRPEAPPVKEPPPMEPDLDRFPCKLGDVVMRDTGEEAWLAGAIVLSEELPARALFWAPEAGNDRVIYASPRPAAQILWLSPIDAKDVLTRGEPPTSLEHGDLRFERTRRLPLAARRVGTGAPDVGEQVIVAEYRSAGPERLIVVLGGTARAFRGVVLEEGMFEVLPSGKATLE
jgi:hypothetical protein